MRSGRGAKHLLFVAHNAHNADYRIAPDKPASHPICRLCSERKGINLFQNKNLRVRRIYDDKNKVGKGQGAQHAQQDVHSMHSERSQRSRQRFGKGGSAKAGGRGSRRWPHERAAFFCDQAQQCAHCRQSHSHLPVIPAPPPPRPFRQVIIYVAYSTRFTGAAEEKELSTSRYRTSVCAVPVSAPSLVPVSEVAAAPEVQE